MISKFKNMLLIFLLILVLTGCAKNPYKNVPGYLGIEVSDTKETPLATYDFSSDQDKPFGDYNIEDKLKDSLTITKSEELDLYTSINKDIYIKILLKNPKKIQIASVLINDVLYESINFEQESDFNNIILKFNVENNQGINEYKLNEINYINGELPKTLKIIENNILKVGIQGNLPYAYLQNINVSYTEITLESIIIDQNKLSKYYKLYLYDGNKLTEISELVLDKEPIEIKDLYYDTIYQLAVVSEYDALDGNGNQLVILDKKTLKTRAAVEIEKVVSGLDYIDFYITSNQKEYSKILSISLFNDNNQLIESLNDLNLREFNNLQSNKNYNIIVKFEYRYGNGEILTSEYKLSTRTKIMPVVEELTIMNTGPIAKNEKIEVNIRFKNPNKEIIHSVIIDGEEIKLGEAVTTTTRIKFTPKSNGELYRLSISGINVLINDEKISYLVESSVYDEITIISKDLEFIDINNENGDKFILYNQNTSLILKFDNPSKHTITKIVLSNRTYYNFEVIDNNHIKIIYKTDLYSYYRYEEIFVQEILFESLDGSSGGLYMSKRYNFCIMNSLDIKLVSTVDELKQMQEGYNYKLINDIDLVGIEWNSLSFAGILDGDGHKISNYNSSKNESSFFAKFTGVLKNVSFLNFSINLNDSPRVAPLILQSSGYLIIKNCSIDYTLNYNNGDCYDYAIGGFVAYNYGYLDISDSTAQGVISLNTSGYGNLYFGGLVGLSEDFVITFNNVQSSGEINIVSNQQIIVGGLLGSGSVEANNCIVNSSIETTNSGSSYVGGLIGNSTYGFIQNCIMNGSINITDSNSAYKYVSGIGNNLTSISNCKNNGNINVNTKSIVYIGGISTSSQQIIASQCEANGDITVITSGENQNGSVANIAGIVNAPQAKIDNCTMSGDINLELEGDAQVAGIMAYHNRQLMIDNFSEINNCQMLGNITINSTERISCGGILNSGTANLTNNKVYSNITIVCYSYVFVGGIIGDGYVNQFIENCSYIGNIIVISDIIAYVGGIAGYYENSTAINMIANNLYVNGRFTIEAYLRTYTGGLFGYIDRGTVFTLNINNAKFEGSINVKATDNAFAGGLIAHSGSKLKISNCEVNGNIKADAGASAYTGGFVASGTLSIKKSLMLANLEVISNSITYVGGFLGYNKYTSNLIIEDTVLLGNILVTVKNPSYYIGDLLGHNYTGAPLTVYNYFMGQFVTAEVNKINLSLTGAPIAQVDLVNSPSFYKNDLHFKETYWDFSEVDYEKRLFPKLILNQ